MRSREAAHDETNRCSRRTFLAGLGCAGAAVLLPKSGGAMSGSTALLCVGSFSKHNAGTIHVVAVESGRCGRLAAAASERPLALAVHPLRPIVYVANGVEQYRYEPRGTVEAFLVDRRSGRLELLARQPLSLSATDPRALAVSPDGSSLLVAAFGGSAYNVLPLNQDGVPGAPSTILKQLGRGSDSPARPAAVLFHPKEGWAVAADGGADRLDLLSAGTGARDAAGFTVRSRVQTKPAAGLSRLALHPNGRLLVAMQQRKAGLTSFEVSRSGVFTSLSEVSLDSTPTSIAFHPRENMLYSAMRMSTNRSKLETWHVDPNAGSFGRVGSLSLPAGDIRTLVCSARALWAASDRGLFAMTLDGFTATPQSWERTATIPGATAVALLSGS